jgi:hypothetical protein
VIAKVRIRVTIVEITKKIWCILMIGEQVGGDKQKESQQGIIFINFLLPGHGWTRCPVHEEGGAEQSTRRRSLGEIPGYLQEIQARGSQRQTPNSKICFL